jgi:hypothetical protein
MPVREQIHRDDYRCKLQATKVDLMSRQGRQQALGSFSQPKASPQVHGQRRDDQGNDKTSVDRGRTLSGFHQSPEQHDQEDGKREHLEGESRQENVVGCRRVLLVGIRHSHQSRACNLNNRRHDVAYDEDPKDELWRHRRVFSPVDCDHDGSERVDRRREADRRDDDEEVLFNSLLANSPGYPFEFEKDASIIPGPRTKPQSKGSAGSTGCGTRIRRSPLLSLRLRC